MDQNQPEVTADLSNVVVADLAPELREDYLNAYGPNLHQVAIGNIGGDGKNRFRHGEQVRTSLLTKDEVVDGVRYLHTLNSVYRVVS